MTTLSPLPLAGEGWGEGKLAKLSTPTALARRCAPTSPASGRGEYQGGGGGGSKTYTEIVPVAVPPRPSDTVYSK